MRKFRLSRSQSKHFPLHGHFIMKRVNVQGLSELSMRASIDNKNAHLRIFKLNWKISDYRLDNYNKLYLYYIVELTKLGYAIPYCFESVVRHTKGRIYVRLMIVVDYGAISTIMLQILSTL